MAGQQDRNPWVWRGSELFDSRGAVIAYVTVDVLNVGEHRLLIEHAVGPMQFRLRATSPEGEVGTVVQSGFAVTTLVADCNDRHYKLARTSPWRKERRILDDRGKVVATVAPRGNDLIIAGGPAVEDYPLVDMVFLTWACTLVDVPGRRTKI